MKQAMMVLLLVLVAGSATAQELQHFDPVNWSGLDPYNVQFRGMTVNGLPLQIGDEVALFEGDVCLNAKVVTEPVTYDESLQVPAAAASDDLPGYHQGEPIEVRVWVQATDTEHEADEDWLVGGTYGTGFISASNPLAVGDPSMYVPDHFFPTSPTEVQHGIVIEMAAINDDAVDIGDELGIFDGDFCVGAYKVPFTLDGMYSFTVVAHGSSDPAPGYDEGNDIVLKVYDGTDMLELDATPEFLFADGAQFEVRDFSTVVSMQSTDVHDRRGEITPDRFELTPVYPNPFNAGANVRLALDRPGTVNVTVVDILGRTVATLNQGPMTAGTHTLHWSAEAPSGRYFLLAEHEGRRLIRTLTLIK